ncbi:MAG: ATP-binding protein [Anaerolineae bacterium]|nr:ATP-binding protein [Anaerolineae bacterium]
MTALERLGGIGAEVAAYRDATSRANKLAALARATGELDDLDKYVQAEVVAPEQYILRRIIRQWRRLVSEAGGVTGRAQVAGPLPNPYVAGNPVEGNLFVGRDDIMRRLEELWSGAGQKPSVVIYGHRRMGKTSILHNVGARFGSQTAVVDFNMQRVGFVASTGELLANLALALYDSLPNAAERGLAEPSVSDYSTGNPYTAFDRFLKQLARVRARRRFIVAVDEFELIERDVLEGKLELHLLDFWRGVIQTYPWFVMAFAGLHTLDEMRHDYWHPLFGSVTAIPVSFLAPAAARQLITNPSPDFDLDYDEAAIRQIIDLTHGQPYLVQLVGHGLVSRFNRQTFEEGVERERRFAAADVQAVIGAPDFYRDGDAYFTGVWRQAETTQPAGQVEVLRVLAQAQGGLSADEIAQRCELASENAQSAIKTLHQHDVLAETDGRWQFTVELMRRWVEDQKPGFGEQARLEKPGF